MRFNRNVEFFAGMKGKIEENSQRVIRYYWLKKLERIRERKRIAAEKAAKYPKSKIKEYRDGTAKVAASGKGYTAARSNKGASSRKAPSKSSANQ